MTDFIYRLLERHQRVDRQLREELARRAPDPFRIQRLKKMKLALRDRLSAMQRRTPILH